MANSKTTLRLMKALYWIGMTLVHLYLCYLAFITNRVILGILWLVAGFILIFLFYFYYFTADGSESDWPPYIAGCPDYLTMVAPNQCVDFVGLNTTLRKSTDPRNPPLASDTQRSFNAGGNMAAKADNAQRYGLTWEGVL